MRNQLNSDSGEPRRGGRRHPRGRAADLQARRHTLAYPELHSEPPSPSGEEQASNDFAARRERRRRRALSRAWRPQSLQMWLVLVVVVLVSVGAIGRMLSMHSEYRRLQAQVDFKQERLASLRAQNERAQRRLAVLTSDKGREELLIKHGYIPPGSRILLFPPDPEERRMAEIPKNDLTPHPPTDDSGGSFFGRTQKSVAAWWRGLGRPDARPSAEN